MSPKAIPTKPLSSTEPISDGIESLLKWKAQAEASVIERVGENAKSISRLVPVLYGILFGLLS